jgi:hypothetical protein
VARVPPENDTLWFWAIPVRVVSSSQSVLAVPSAVSRLAGEGAEGDLRADEGAVLVAAQHLELPRRGARPDVAVVLHRRGAGRALLGLDQHHAVRAAAPVDRRRRRVLEDRDVRDVGGVDQVERVARERRGVARDPDAAGLGVGVLDRHAVDHVERLVARADRRCRRGCGSARRRPGSPLFTVTLTPAARPWIRLFTLGTTPTFACSAFTVDTAPVIALRRCVP